MRTLLCQARCSLGGEPEVPCCRPVRTAYRQPRGASRYASGLPRVFQPWLGKFFLRAHRRTVRDSGQNIIGAPASHNSKHCEPRVNSTRERRSGAKNRQMTLFLALLDEHEPIVDQDDRCRPIGDLFPIEADPALVDCTSGITL